MKAYEARVGSERAWARIEAKLRAMDPAAFIGFARALSEQTPVRERLGEIGCPALVLVGDQDEPFLAPSQAMAEALPDARHVVIPDAAHSPQLENPAAWFEAIRGHLSRVRA
jgi:pimeloyl-ACP methyl ester carboxylesterase